ncbi:hypothetical protein ACLBWS_17145 [Brucellaceae bacterium D45D]
MSDTFDYIMRFAVIVCGYCCALLAAGWFATAILFRTIGVDAMMQDFVMLSDRTDVGAIWAATSFWSTVFVGGFVMAFLAGGISLLPTVVAVIIAEIRGYRSSIFYAIFGGVIGLASAGAIVPFNDSRDFSYMSLLVLASACAGIVGGFVYWLIAGRNAGRLVNRPTA